MISPYAAHSLKMLFIYYLLPQFMKLMMQFPKCFPLLLPQKPLHPTHDTHKRSISINWALHERCLLLKPAFCLPQSTNPQTFFCCKSLTSTGKQWHIGTATRSRQFSQHVNFLHFVCVLAFLHVCRLYVCTCVCVCVCECAFVYKSKSKKKYIHNICTTSKCIHPRSQQHLII